MRDIGIQVDDPAWQTSWPDCAEAAIRAANAVLDAVFPEARRALEISILLTDDDAIAVLNARYRERAGPTNVLSFSCEDAEALMATDPRPLILGDVAVARGVVCREAAAQGKPVADHATHMIVHGTLHLLGFDHIDDAEAADMEARETAILSNLGVPDPYVLGSDPQPSEAGQ